MEKVNLMQIGVYNPQRQNAYLTEALFVARKSEFKSIMEGLKDETPDSIPQHYLIIGQRGMGKTTLLKRIDIELQKEMFTERYIPILLPEEQYNLHNLADLWLNCFHMLLEYMFEKGLDSNGNIDVIEREIDRIMKETKDSFYLCESLYTHFMNVCKSMHLRPVILLDNIGLALDRLNVKEQNIFRGYLSKNECPIIIGAGVVMAGVSDIKEHIINYKAPFYDFFQSYKLKRLNSTELIEIINRLSEITKIGITINASNSVRLKSLFQLTGGNPRNVVILFKLLVRGFSETIVEDLEALIDDSTPLNKARFEELPAQQQIILNAIAQNWDPIHISDISEITRLKNNQISPHLNHLIATGWLETTKIDTYEWESKKKNSVNRRKKGNVYSLSERFLAIWLILRNGRLQKKNEIRKVLESYVWLFSIEIDEQNVLDEIEKACKEKDFKKAINSKKYLIHLYRDINKQLYEAEELFNTINPDDLSRDVYLLEKVLFELHKHNEGIATDYLLQALNEINNNLNPETKSDWEYFSAITIKIGYARWLLDILSKTGFKTNLSPLYVAIQALEIERKNGLEMKEIYLKNQAIEKSDPARIIMERMKKYLYE
ncbi:MAG: hypothetical protein FWG98_04485 [Candidatus Cloacimonetes bacterium]|nr:hypothetical protein [Candidatus Cloacimonadota bacterium]